MADSYSGNGDDDRHVLPQLAGEAEGAVLSGPGKPGNGCHQVLFNLAIAAITGVNLRRISAEHV